MRALSLFLLFLTLVWAAPVQRTFRLEPGGYRWVPFTVSSAPVRLEAHFQADGTRPAVRLELLPMSDFRLYSRGRPYQALGTTDEGESGALIHILDDPAQYVLIISNDRHVGNQTSGSAATVVLDFEVDSDYAAHLPVRTLAPQERLIVIMASFGLFFAIVTFSGWRLVRGIKGTR